MADTTPRIVIGSDPGRARRRVAVGLLALAAFAAGGVAAWWWSGAQPEEGTLPAGPDRALAAARDKIQRLEQRIAILERGGQVTELANRQLRVELADMEGEVARLTDEVGFYQRLVGAGGGERGLAVHALQLAATPSDRVFRFELTLSQNLEKADQVTGHLELTVEGVQADRTRVLGWTSLGVRMEGDGNQFGFKYFQQLNGSLELPPDFHPERIIVSLHPEGNTPQVAQSFVWSELMRKIKDV